MRIGFQAWGSNVGWDALMDAAEAIEAHGFDDCFANDHFVPVAFAGDAEDPRAAGPIFEAMATIGGWAAGRPGSASDASSPAPAIATRGCWHGRSSPWITRRAGG